MALTLAQLRAALDSSPMNPHCYTNVEEVHQSPAYLTLVTERLPVDEGELLRIQEDLESEQNLVTELRQDVDDRDDKIAELEEQCERLNDAHEAAAKAKRDAAALLKRAEDAEAEVKRLREVARVFRDVHAIGALAHSGLLKDHQLSSRILSAIEATKNITI